MKNNLIGISGKIGSGKDTVGEIIQYLIDPQFNPSKGFSFKEYLEETKLESKPNSKYQVKKYADKLKDIVCLLIGCTREQLEDREFKEKELGEEWWYYKYGYDLYPYYEKEFIEAVLSEKFLTEVIKLTPRKLLQLLGTECGRQILHPNIWVNSLFSEYRPLDIEKRNSLINVLDYSDCSFPNWIITDVRFPNEAKAIKDRGGVIIRVNRSFKDIEGSIIRVQNSIATLESNHPSETALDDYEFDYTIENDGSIEDLVEKVKKLNLI